MGMYYNVVGNYSPRVGNFSQNDRSMDTFYSVINDIHSYAHCPAC